MIKETDPPNMGQLYNITWIHYIALPFWEYINSIVTLEKSGIVAKWFTTEEKTFINSSKYFFNIDECTLYNKGNSCGAIAIPVIEITYFTMKISK